MSAPDPDAIPATPSPSPLGTAATWCGHRQHATTSCLPIWLEATEADIVELCRSRQRPHGAARAQRLINRTGGAPSAIGSIPIAWVDPGQGNRDLVGISRLCLSIGRPDRLFVVDGASCDFSEITTRMLVAIEAAEFNFASSRDEVSYESPATAGTASGGSRRWSHLVHVSHRNSHPFSPEH